ncbi:PTS sugar transporter subunit IIA, partial [Streptomyces sp. NPDC000931]
MTELVTTELVDLDLAPTDRRAAVRSLAERLRVAGRVTDLERFLADVEDREAQMSTGLPGGIGIPHCRSEAVTVPTLAIGRSAQ